MGGYDIGASISAPATSGASNASALSFRGGGGSGIGPFGRGVVQGVATTPNIALFVVGGLAAGALVAFLIFKLFSRK